jgi:tetrahydromethanopterin S-methyltransferase subunit G
MTETRGRNSNKNVMVSISASDIELIKKTLSNISEKVQEMDLTLLKLNQTIIGDSAYGQKGLVEQVKEHTQYIESDKTYKAKVVGAGSVLVILYGLVIKFWEKIF